MIAAALIAFEVIIEGFCVSAARATTFGSAAFQERDDVQAFKKLHDDDSLLHDKSASLKGIKWEKGGYPDMGNGPVGRLLSYADWHRLARAQRAHYNAVEGVATAVTLTIIAGLALPIPAAACGFAIFLGRIMYGCGYRGAGPSGRLVGVLFIDLALLGQLGMSIYSGLKVAGV